MEVILPELHIGDTKDRAIAALKDLPGVESARLSEQGAWITFRPASVTAEAICESLRRQGFKADIFQDSESDREPGASPP